MKKGETAPATGADNNIIHDNELFLGVDIVFHDGWDVAEISGELSPEPSDDAATRAHAALRFLLGRG